MNRVAASIETCEICRVKGDMMNELGNRLSSDKVTPHTVRVLAKKAAVSLIIILSLSACGSGGGGGGNGGSVTGVEQSPINSLTVTSDGYGLMTPNFFYSTDNTAFWSIQSNVANDVWDQNFQAIIRIDIPKTGNNVMPDINKTFSIEDNPLYTKFPGTFYVFNGHVSVYKKVEQGTISFSIDPTSSNTITGAFDVILTDYDSTIIPAPQYHLTGVLSFKVGTYGPANPMPAAVYPLQGKAAYDQLCSSCHLLGTYDPIHKSASDLSLRGGELPTVYPGARAEHVGISLDQQTMQDLRIFLNAE